MATRHNNLGRGSLLWGQGFRPVTYMPPDLAASITSQETFATITVGTRIPLDGPHANSDANDENAYLPCSMALYLDQNDDDDTTLVVTYHVDGKNQFGQDIEEDVTLTGLQNLYTLHCYSFVRHITVTAIANVQNADYIQVGWLGNVLAMPLPLPFYPRDDDHIEGISFGLVRLLASDLTIDKARATAIVGIVSGPAPDLGTAEGGQGQIHLINGAATVY